MSLESAIEGLTAAIKENTAAMRELEAKVDGPAEAKPAKPAKPKKSADEKPAAKAEKPKVEKDEAPAVDKKTLTAKIIELAKTKGRDAASRLLAEYDAQKVPELDASVYDEVFTKAEELLG